MADNDSVFPPLKRYATNFFNLIIGGEEVGTSWNYRIIQDGERWYIGEVYYAEDGKPEGYTETGDALDGWDRQEDLITTYRLIGQALDKPYLRVAADGSLTERLA